MSMLRILRKTCNAMLLTALAWRSLHRLWLTGSDASSRSMPGKRRGFTRAISPSIWNTIKPVWKSLLKPL
jgi:hypothetical protein